MAFNDFSKIMELVELRELLKGRDASLDKETGKIQEQVQEIELEIKEIQGRVRKLREYLNDGQRLLDSLPQRYGAQIKQRQDRMTQLTESISKIEAELVKMGVRP